jgi:hypothetical protein
MALEVAGVAPLSKDLDVDWLAVVLHGRVTAAQEVTRARGTAGGSSGLYLLISVRRLRCKRRGGRQDLVWEREGAGLRECGRGGSGYGRRGVGKNEGERRLRPGGVTA